MPPAPVLTGDPIAGIHTYFALGNSALPSVLQDISDFLDGVEPTEEVDELDGTTFRRETRNIIAGFRTVGYSLSASGVPPRIRSFRRCAERPMLPSSTDRKGWTLVWSLSREPATSSATPDRWRRTMRLRRLPSNSGS